MMGSVGADPCWMSESDKAISCHTEALVLGVIRRELTNGLTHQPSALVPESNNCCTHFLRSAIRMGLSK